jgi:hypothetical protein
MPNVAVSVPANPVSSEENRGHYDARGTSEPRNLRRAASGSGELCARLAFSNNQRLLGFVRSLARAQLLTCAEQLSQPLPGVRDAHFDSLGGGAEDLSGFVLRLPLQSKKDDGRP